jgi:hypothetical protein
MRENATRPDFAPEGSLALKAWFGSNRGLDLPPVLNVPVVEATPPYNAQIAALNEQIGALLPRQSMKDTSGASQMDAKSQVTSLHGVTMLEAAQYPMESNICLALSMSPGARTIVSWSCGDRRRGQSLRRRDAGGGAGFCAKQATRRIACWLRPRASSAPAVRRGPQGCCARDRARQGRIGRWKGREV